MTTDPCACYTQCPEGRPCLGGHAYRPDAHWYACDVCSPPDGSAHRLPDGRYQGTVTACGHTIEPVYSIPAVALALREHRRTCPDLDTANTLTNTDQETQ